MNETCENRTKSNEEHKNDKWNRKTMHEKKHKENTGNKQTSQTHGGPGIKHWKYTKSTNINETCAWTPKQGFLAIIVVERSPFGCYTREGRSGILICAAMSMIRYPVRTEGCVEAGTFLPGNRTRYGDQIHRFILAIPTGRDLVSNLIAWSPDNQRAIADIIITCVCV